MKIRVYTSTVLIADAAVTSLKETQHEFSFRLFSSCFNSKAYTVIGFLTNHIQQWDGIVTVQKVAETKLVSWERGS